MSRAWVSDALRRIEADFNRSADTHLLRLELPAFPGLILYFKDESSHPTGSLKHRLARSLFLYGLSNGWIGPETTIVEASSGSTAVSEAYFARLIGLPFVAVMPHSTSAEKIAQIEFYGGRCHLVEAAAHVYAEAERLAGECGGHYMDQFTYAERATDWRGNNNIAESILQQMALEEHPVPRWIVVGAGTGGTSATIGRYLRYRDFATGLCVTDVENSVFFDYWRLRDPSLVCERPSRIEGIGRPRVEASFQPDVVDRMIRVPDAASLAAMRIVSGLLGRRVGASTGTHFAGVLQLLCEMKAAGETGSIVTLLCDSGERYAGSCYRDDWLAGQGIDIAPELARLQAVLGTGIWRD
ncbi:PLP-dependent cysteine synthase family protein [Ferrovibrio xuzhouensis]|uniref:L-cysteine desulfhydrase Cds1 n=1 Tax=Ferrovibrio xuzhouensis TaxID=1576914 RepID=A0ABV7VHV5_9PROT